MYNAATAYQDQSVVTAGPAQLVTMLYDGILAAIARCRADSGFETVNRELQRAQDILDHLTATLDHERGGEVARNLASLYAYLREQLMQANLSKNLALLDPVEFMVTDIRDAWQQATAGVSE